MGATRSWLTACAAGCAALLPVARAAPAPKTPLLNTTRVAREANIPAAQRTARQLGRLTRVTIGLISFLDVLTATTGRFRYRPHCTRYSSNIEGSAGVLPCRGYGG